jgi:sugar phosphate isomerase/epimerase
MKNTRRTFIKKGALALAGTAVLKEALFATSGHTVITGLQLYSIRDDMMRDPPGSLAILAETGYRYLEHANYENGKFYGYSASELKRILDDMGLIMISGHTEMGIRHWDQVTRDFSDSWKRTLEDAARLGQKYVISPWIDENLRKNYDDFRVLMDVFNKCGELCRKEGMKFGYHNHNYEFRQKFNNETLFDIFMKSTDPDLVTMQLDLGNLFDGGAVALDVAGKYPGRFDNVHVKDVIRKEDDGQYESTIIGTGVADVRNVLALLGKTGKNMTLIIEQESYQGKTPMDCIKEDLRIIKEWGY